MWLKSISVIISFFRIIFEIEHYECKSRMMHVDEGMHADVWDKTSNFFHFGGRGFDIKRYGFPLLSHM